MTYRAAVCRSLGTPGVLAIENLPSAELGANEIRIGIKAAGLNFPDLLMVAGRYQFKPPLPFVPGIESAGKILEVGKDVRGFAAGDSVMARHRTGGYAEQAVIPAESATLLPAGFSFAEGASFFVGFITAWHALVTRGAVQPGERVLVLGAGGGVGLAAVRIAAHLGAEVIAAASTSEKRAVAAAQGAAHLIDSRDERIDLQVKELTGGHGAEVIYDPVGLPAAAITRAAAFGGRVLVIGFTGDAIPEFPTNRILMKCISLIGVRAGEYSRDKPRLRKQETAALMQLAHSGAIRPHVSRSFPLADCAEALATLASRDAVGRIVIVP